jgi:hypothetical protein
LAVAARAVAAVKIVRKDMVLIVVMMISYNDSEMLKNVKGM